MKCLLAIFLSIFINNLFAQINYSEDSIYAIKPLLMPKEEVYYNILEKTNVDDKIFHTNKSILSCLVSFKLMDTAKGYWMRYMVHNVETKTTKYFAQALFDSLTIGMKLYFRMTKNGWETDSNSYFKMKNKFLKEIDSILMVRKFSPSDSFLLVEKRLQLSKKEGLESFMTPLVLFNYLYDYRVVKKQRKFYFGYYTDILGNKGAYGLIENKIKEMDLLNKHSTISIKFTPNRESAAKEYAQVFANKYDLYNKNGYTYITNKMNMVDSYLYDIDLLKCIPTKISYKSKIKFITLVTTDFEMTLQQ